MDILCFSTTDWDEIWGSRQQIMSRLSAAGNRVLFIERQVGPEHLLRDPALRARKYAAWRAPALRQIQPSLWLWQPPLLPPGRYYSQRLNNWGQWLLACKIRPVLKSLEFQPPLLWLYPPHSAPLLGKFNEPLAVYHCIERFVGGQTGRKRDVMLAQETVLLRRADVVFVHADGLRRLYTPLAQRLYVVPSAADVAHFQSTTEVYPDVASLPHPRLGIIGTLDGRIDIDLLCTIVQAHPDWHLILIGPIRPGRADFRTLKAHSNVHFLGERSFSTLPALANGLDVLLLPYVHNELTDFISPIKLYEYLAVGKPIVSVNLPEIEPVREWVSTADTPSAFVQAIVQALSTDKPALRQARQNAAWQHTWDLRARTMWQIIQQTLERSSDAAC
ncbi:MAG: glycosyltransferase [Anaerolineae bacterium]|nr:glycosyltransferase [Anaerolineae bacterium]